MSAELEKNDRDWQENGGMVSVHLRLSVFRKDDGGQGAVAY